MPLVSSAPANRGHTGRAIVVVLGVVFPAPHELHGRWGHHLRDTRAEVNVIEGERKTPPVATTQLEIGELYAFSIQIERARCGGAGIEWILHASPHLSAVLVHTDRARHRLHRRVGEKRHAIVGGHDVGRLVRHVRSGAERLIKRSKDGGARHVALTGIVECGVESAKSLARVPIAISNHRDGLIQLHDPFDAGHGLSRTTVDRQQRAAKDRRHVDGGVQHPGHREVDPVDRAPVDLRGNVKAWSSRPFTCTVQAPHAEMPHPNFVPVKPSVSRSAHSSGVSGSTSREWARPFTVIVIAIALPSVRDSHCNPKFVPRTRATLPGRSKAAWPRIELLLGDDDQDLAGADESKLPPGDVLNGPRVLLQTSHRIPQGIVLRAQSHDPLIETQLCVAGPTHGNEPAFTYQGLAEQNQGHERDRMLHDLASVSLATWRWRGVFRKASLPRVVIGWRDRRCWMGVGGSRLTSRERGLTITCQRAGVPACGPPT